LEPRLAGGEDRALLQAAVSEAQAAAEAARVEQGRAEQLLAERAVPARRLEEARRAVTVAEARLHAAEMRLAQRDETLRSGGGELLIGQNGTAVLYKRDRARMPAVPKAAVLLEAGRPYVFVQVSGERFARRFVEIATRDGDLVGLKSGVKPGDRVVIRGAYDI